MHPLPDAWTAQGAEPPPLHAAEVRAWRDAIVRSQQPAESCSAARLCSCSPHRAGLTSKLHAAAICVMHAALRECAIVGDPARIDEYTTSKVLRERGCVGWNCYFLPISKCHNASGPTRTVSTDQRHLLGAFRSVENRTGLGSEMLIFATAMAWSTRPTPLLARAELQHSRLGAPSGGGRELLTPRCVGAHLRRGDKIGAPRWPRLPDVPESAGRAVQTLVASHVSAESIWRCGARTHAEHIEPKRTRRTRLAGLPSARPHAPPSARPPFFRAAGASD